MPDGALVLVSSQLPVGTRGELEHACASEARRRVESTFACSPENLRLGKAIDVFTQSRSRRRRRSRRPPIGARSPSCFAPITDRIEWMSVESAEMTKHAINAFLATSVTFINELAPLCEAVGRRREGSRARPEESNVGSGHQAYLSPGAAFAGGTLARDVMFSQISATASAGETPLLDGVEASNRAHRNWARRQLTRRSSDRSPGRRSRSGA